MSILDLFGINKNTQPVDAIRSGKELRERQEELGQATGGITEELMKQNPDLFNQITSSFTSPVIGNKFSVGDLFTARSALQGSPFGMFGLGMLALQNLPKESPTDKVGLASFGGDYDPYGYKSALQHGNLGARQDPFGRNIVSGFSNYEKNRRAEIARLSKLKELTQFQKDKLDFGKKYLQKLEQERQAKIQEMQDRNRSQRTGGYQYGTQGGGGGAGKDFMEGSGTAKDMGSF
jgi:hypothetical protein